MYMFATNNNAITRLLICAAVALLPAAMAVAASDKPQPVTITADDAQLSKPGNVSTYTGNVVIVRGTLTLKGDKLVIHRLKNGEYKAVLTGNPSTLRREPETKADELVTGHGDAITYFTGKAEIILSGAAVINRGGDIIHSEVIRHEMNTQKTYAGDQSDDSDRVKMVLHPDDNGSLK